MKYFSSRGSGLILASKLIYPGPCFLTSVMAYGDAANDVEVIIYDSPSATGRIVCQIPITAALDYGGRDYNFPAECYDALYAYLTGTNVSAIIEYMPKA